MLKALLLNNSSKSIMQLLSIQYAVYVIQKILVILTRYQELTAYGRKTIFKKQKTPFDHGIINIHKVNTTSAFCHIFSAFD
jgi:hypothetical protein